MEKIHQHSSHPKIIKRLKRAEGHLLSVIKMMEDERSCVDIAQQLHAVQNAITNAKRELIHDHLDHCISDEDKVSNVDELREIAKYL